MHPIYDPSVHDLCYPPSSLMTARLLGGPDLSSNRSYQHTLLFRYHSCQISPTHGLILFTCYHLEDEQCLGKGKLDVTKFNSVFRSSMGFDSGLFLQI